MAADNKAVLRVSATLVALFTRASKLLRPIREASLLSRSPSMVCRPHFMYVRRRLRGGGSSPSQTPPLNTFPKGVQSPGNPQRNDQKSFRMEAEVSVARITSPKPPLTSPGSVLL